MNTVTIQFDYTSIAPGERKAISDAAVRINLRLKKTLDDMVEIGRELVAVKDQLPHGQFAAWIDAEFGWSQRTAQGFIRVARAFANTQNLRISPSAAIRLAAGTTPDGAFAEAIQRAEAGEEISHGAAGEIIAKHKGQRDCETTVPELMDRFNAIVPTVAELTEWVDEQLAVGVPDPSPMPPIELMRAAIDRETDPEQLVQGIRAFSAMQNIFAERHLRSGRELGKFIGDAKAAGMSASDLGITPDDAEKYEKMAASMEAAE